MRKSYLPAILIFLSALGVYLFFCRKEYEVLNYFLPLANSMLHGRLDISCALPFNELVEVGGRCFVVYPPMPAIALLPVALLLGESISQVYPGIVYGALAGVFAYLYLKRISDERIALALTLLLLFGTNFFMTNLMGRSWYFAHVLSIFFMSISLLFASKKQAFWSGLFLGLAGMSRLPMLLAFPALIYLIKPSKKDLIRFFAPYGLIVLLFLVYNYYRFGSIFQTGYSLIPGVLDEYWFKEGIFSTSYIPRNLEAMLWSFPQRVGSFPYLVPSTMSMALWLATPALLLLFFVGRNKLSLVMLGTFVLVMLPNLMHGTVGFSQFGYRFSLDGILLLLTALIPALKSKVKLSYSLILVSIMINFYAAIEYYLHFFKP